MGCHAAQVQVIRNVLYDVLRTCLEFCTLVDAHDDAPTLPQEQLKSVEKSFNQLAMLMIMLLRRSSSHQALLLRLTYNGYFDSKVTTTS